MITSIKVASDNMAADTCSVLVEGDNREELTNLATRNKVLSEARSAGYPAGGLDGLPHPYPIDDAGTCTEDLVMGKKPFKCWQAKYLVRPAIR